MTNYAVINLVRFNNFVKNTHYKFKKKCKTLTLMDLLYEYNDPTIWHKDSKSMRSNTSHRRPPMCRKIAHQTPNNLKRKYKFNNIYNFNIKQKRKKFK